MNIDVRPNTRYSLLYSITKIKIMTNFMSSRYVSRSSFVSLSLWGWSFQSPYLEIGFRIRILKKLDLDPVFLRGLIRIHSIKAFVRILKIWVNLICDRIRIRFSRVSGPYPVYFFFWGSDPGDPPPGSATRGWKQSSVPAFEVWNVSCQILPFPFKQLGLYMVLLLRVLK